MGFINKNPNMRLPKVQTGLGKVLADEAYRVLLEKGAQASHEMVDRHIRKVKDAIKDSSIGLGVKIGTVLNGDKSLVNSAQKDLSYKHTVSAIQQSSRSDSKIYKTVFQVGQPTSRSLYQFARNKTIDTKSLVDTERDYLSTEKRRALTLTFGFNQRAYDFLGEDTFMKAKDYKFLFQSFQPKFKTRLANRNVYGNILYEHLNLMIKSETDYYSVRLKLHLVKITNPEMSVPQLVSETFNESLETNSNFKVPVDRQLSVVKKIGDFRHQILTDQKCTLSLSDAFKDNAQVVKTFSRVLGPQDIWHFKYYLHYGPGLYLNRLYEEATKNKKFSDFHPVGYFFILQSEGDPRASITRTSDGENFNGSGPGRLTMSFQKTLKFVKEPDIGSEVFTIREFVSNDEDFEDTTFQNYFTPDRASKINVNYENVNINRVEDSNQDYQLRYGEGRLAVYVDAGLRNWLNKNLKIDPDEEQQPDIDTEEGPAQNTTDPGGLFDPDDPRYRRLKGSKPTSLGD